MEPLSNISFGQGDWVCFDDTLKEVVDEELVAKEMFVQIERHLGITVEDEPFYVLTAADEMMVLQVFHESCSPKTISVARKFWDFFQECDLPTDPI